jgi:hypothetical protein
MYKEIDPKKPDLITFKNSEMPRIQAHRMSVHAQYRYEANIVTR